MSLGVVVVVTAIGFFVLAPLVLAWVSTDPARWGRVAEPAPGASYLLNGGLGFATAGTLPGTGLSSAMADALPNPRRGAAGRGWFEAEDCTASLEVGRAGGAPFRVSARCPVAPGAVPPVTFGFRTEF